MEKQQSESKWYGVIFGICILAALAIAAMPWMGEVGVADPKTAETGGLWMNFLGKFHPLFLHLPIGATVLVLSMESLGLISFGKYKPNTTLALAFAAVTSIFAVVFGYFLYLTGKYEGPTLEDHKRDGVIFSVLIILTFLAKYSYDVKKLTWLKPSYLVALLATVGMMMSAGHHGGEMTHGDPLDSLPSKIAEKREAENDKPVVTDPVIYTNIVHNILQNKCIDCHGEDKEKGGLRLDSMAAMFEGGDEEECLVAGDVEASFMITSILLPKDDDYHMPPKSKPQITPEELSILKWWIEMGAPEDKKLSEVKVPEEIAIAIASLKTPEELEEERKKIKLVKDQAEKQFKEKRKQLKATLHTVNEALPGSLRYLSQEDTSLVFNSVSYRKTFSGSDLQMLEPVAGDVVELDLASTNISDADVAHLAKFTNLKKLKLSNTKITDEALKVIGKMESLQSLNLYETGVTDAGVMSLSSLPQLERTYLGNTKVTPESGAKLQAALQKSASDKGNDIKPIVEMGITNSKVNAK